MKFKIRSWLLCAVLVLLAACKTNMVIVNDVEEREANEIVVFLASKNITAEKMSSTAAGPAGGATVSLWNIAVPSDQTTEAMALLNQNGLPRRRGVSLLDLFGKASMISTEREETIRYQAGLAEQIANTIRKIDGVIDADVQLSFPPPETGIPGTSTAPKKVTASVYVKHQGILDDPNSHLVTKIKRLVSGSVTGLDVNDVTVISDRSRLTDITLMPQMEELTPKPKEYVSIWSIVMSKSSASRFRTLFFVLCVLTLVLGAAIGWLIWKFYPLLKKGGGFKELLNPIPVETKRAPKKERAPPEENP